MNAPQSCISHVSLYFKTYFNGFIYACKNPAAGRRSFTGSIIKHFLAILFLYSEYLFQEVDPSTYYFF